MNSFGRKFRVSVFGESHGTYVGICIDGCPAGIRLSSADFEHDIVRRKAGAKGTTKRVEDDTPELISGVYNGYTTGAPVTILFANKNARSHDYEQYADIPRPGHADFVAHKKFNGYNDPRGGGHFSGRLTLPLVAAGVIAKKVIDPISVAAKLVQVGGSDDISATIEKAMANGDSVGGVVECSVQNVPVGLGEPFFDSLESLLAHILFSIPAVKGVEFGAGFTSATMLGSQHNDAIENVDGKTSTNHTGGINGGISNGNELTLRVAVKPTPSIAKEQQTVNLRTGERELLSVTGRHDSCIALRVPVVVEAAVAIVLVDMLLLK